MNQQQFLEKLGTSPIVLTPEQRSQLRSSFRNERILYKRKCDLCHKNIISIYSTDKPYTVYCQDCFWGDKWDSLENSLEIDTKKPFLDQFAELMKKTPRLAIINKQCENSEYCNYSFANKNCYLTFGNHYEEDCLYGHYSTKNKNCVDYLWMYSSELCYECLYSRNCYKSAYLDHCEDSTECYFSVDLKGCKNCIGCANLRNKQYYIYNKGYSKKDYFDFLDNLKLNTFTGFSTARNFFVTEFRTKFPFRAIYQTACQNCEGNNLENCKNLENCIDCTGCEDCANGFQMDETHDSMDMTCMGYDKSELCYQTIGCSGIYNCVCCDSCWQDSDLKYCQLCFSSKNCLGCISLKHKEYCILNKQYSKEEYEKLSAEIIDKMKKEGIYGHFFPLALSPFAYNETVANESFPLSKAEATKKGYSWKDDDKKDFAPQTYKIPDRIDDVQDDILDEILACEQTGKNYKITPHELDFYRKTKLPIPQKCPEQRYLDRNNLKQPRKLWARTCAKCGKDIQTVYFPDCPETIYCEDCYLKTIY